MGNWIFATLFVIIALLALFVIGIVISTVGIEDDACQAIGFTKYSLRPSPSCEDAEGNLHFVKITYGRQIPFIRAQCTAKLIRVGDVEVYNG